MATTSYFEEFVPHADKHANAVKGAPETAVEIQVSSFSGTHQLYLKLVDPAGVEQYLVLNKATSNDLLDGLDRAMAYLGYNKP